MQRLIIKNIGPIIEADITLKKVNVFIGPQSSGKSTIAKIISFCSWLEKNKHDLEKPDLFAGNVIERMISYHRMEGYIASDSIIFYQGDNIAFAYNWPKSEVIPLEFQPNSYNVSHTSEKETFFLRLDRLSNPKVLYIPAERNFVSVVPNLQKYDESKDSLQSFVVDWYDAKRSFKKEKALDIIDLGMKYFSDNDEDYIQIGAGKSIRLRNASSGLQSVTPLLVVSDYMTKGMYEKERPFSVEEQDVLNKLLHDLAVDSTQINNVAELKRRLYGFLTGKVYSHTQFIIEEPEQNLFPKEQYKLIEYLAGIINHGKQHRLTITTHSPYIMTALNNLIQAGDLASQSLANAQKIESRFKNLLHYNEVAAFSINNGVVESIMDEDLRMISAESLDYASQELSDDFNFLMSL